MKTRSFRWLTRIALATAGSGALGSVGELGTSIIEMQNHISGLQKNIDTLKNIRAALGA
jgi:hypothetical protein